VNSQTSSNKPGTRPVESRTQRSHRRPSVRTSTAELVLISSLPFPSVVEVSLAEAKEASRTFAASPLLFCSCHDFTNFATPRWPNSISKNFNLIRILLKTTSTPRFISVLAKDFHKPRTSISLQLDHKATPSTPSLHDNHPNGSSCSFLTITS
jgi:hypothetical protein